VNERVLQLADGEIAAVGYGSLLSVESISRTLKAPYSRPFIACQIEGWRRSWNVSMPNQAFYYEEGGDRVYPPKIIYLNVRPVPKALMNCAVFVLDLEQLKAMHAREWIYDPAKVTEQLRGVRITGGEAIMYVGKPEHAVHEVSSPRQAAIRASYLRILESALERAGPALSREFERSTDPVPKHLVIKDTLDPDQPSPWLAAGHDYRP
jgi:hypothetical protein